MLPALYRHAIYTGMRMSVYEEVRNTLQKENKVSNHKKKSSYKYILRRPQNFAKSPDLFYVCTTSRIYGGDFAKLCGLLRIYELYLAAE